MGVEAIHVGCAPSGFVWPGQQYVLRVVLNDKVGVNTALELSGLHVHTYVCWMQADGRLVFCFSSNAMVDICCRDLVWLCGAKQKQPAFNVVTQKRNWQNGAAGINGWGRPPGVFLAAAVTICFSLAACTKFREK